jgi:hypothetical protein
VAKTLIPDNWQPNAKTWVWATANGYDVQAHLDFFVDYCQSKEAKYADFDAAFRNCCRADWGGVRRNAKRVATKVAAPAWWTTESATLAHGEARGLPPRRGETMDQYRARLRNAEDLA